MTHRLPTASAALTTLVLWASAFIAIRIAVPSLGVGALSLGRLLVASTVLAVAAPLLGVRRPARADLPRIVACGACGMTAYQVLLNAGQRSVPAGTAALLVTTAPVLAAVLAHVALGERLTARARTGVGVAAAGAILLVTSSGGGQRPGVDALLVLGAALAQAAFFVLQKPLLDRRPALEVTCHVMWAGTVLALPLLPWLISDLPGASRDALLALLFLGVGPSAIGFVTWAYVQARMTVTVAATTLYLVPGVALVVGRVALDEPIRLPALAGGGLAVAGVVLSRRAGPPVRPQDRHVASG